MEHFLLESTLTVTVDGHTSFSPVVSGLPRGTDFGAILFNDLKPQKEIQLAVASPVLRKYPVQLNICVMQYNHS